MEKMSARFLVLNSIKYRLKAPVYIIFILRSFMFISGQKTDKCRLIKTRGEIPSDCSITTISENLIYRYTIYFEVPRNAAIYFLLILSSLVLSSEYRR